MFGYTVRPIQFPYAAFAEISCWVSGIVVEFVGYSNFFLITAAIGVPVVGLVMLVMRWVPESADET